MNPVLAQTLQRAWATWAPPPELTVSEFADREIVVTSGPRSGAKWRTDFAPYQRGIMDAIHEDGVQFVVVMGSAQWGKTSCAVNICCFHIAHDPCPILVVEPDEKPMAVDFAKNRLDPTIRSSPTLHAAVDRKRAKDASNTTLLKTYRGGFIALAGSHSGASLAARAVRLLILDEVERYDRELRDEGSTIDVAVKRTQTYQARRRIVMLSTPKLSGGPIHTWFQRGDQRRYYVPCPACGHRHPYEWRHVRWERDDQQTARLVCPECGHGISDAERLAALGEGEWRAEHPDRADRRIVSFHLWEAYSPMSSLSDIVAGFLAARAGQKAGDPAPMHTWQNTTLGEPVEPDLGEGVESHVVLLRREEYGTEIDLPQGVCCLTMGVDTQDDRLELLVVGWGVGEESWVIDRQTLPGDTSHPHPWKELDRLIAHEYRHACGRRMGIRAVAIDSAGHRTDMVYHYAALWSARRVYAIIGRDSAPIVSSPSPRRYGQGERSVPLYTIGTDAAKALLYSRLKLTEQGPGFIHLPISGWCDDEFAAQLTSERLKATFERGIKREVWKKIRPRNESLDCYIYALGAFYQQQPDAKRRADWLQQLASEWSPEQPTSPATPSVPGVKRNPFLSGRSSGDWLRGRR